MRRRSRRRSWGIWLHIPCVCLIGLVVTAQSEYGNGYAVFFVAEHVLTVLIPLITGMRERIGLVLSCLRSLARVLLFRNYCSIKRTSGDRNEWLRAKLVHLVMLQSLRLDQSQAFKEANTTQALP